MASLEQKPALGRLALIVTTLIWGTSFVIMKSTLDSVPVLYLLALRFTGAVLILIPFCLKEFRKIDKGTVIGGIAMGVALFSCYVLQTYGLAKTTPGKNAFLTAVYCMIVPLLYWLIRKKRPDRYNVAAAVICIIGIGLISLDGDLGINIGDVLTILGGICFAVHIVVIDYAAKDHSVMLLSIVQFAAVAVLSWCSAFIFSEPLKPIPTSSMLSILYLSFFCTGACFVLQAIGQKHTPPAQASVILTFESVFGAAISVCMGLEVVSLRLFLGFAMMFAAVIISETKLSFFKKLSAPEKVEK